MSIRRVVAPSDAEFKITVDVSNDGVIQTYRISRFRPLSRLMQAVAICIGVQQVACVFELNDRVLEKTMMPDQIGLDEHSMIHVRVVQ
jgi:hypothetical protein